MELIKKIERGYRQVRSYLQPSHYKSAAKARSLATPPPTNQPICLFDFHSIKIDNVMGRYLHHLITEFETCGYHIAFTNNYRFLATIESKAFKRLIFKRPFSILHLNDAPDNCNLLITDNDKNPDRAFDKTINIDYRQMRAPEGDKNSIELPFFVHPEIHDSQQIAKFHKTTQKQSRSLRILFAGNARAPKYDSPILEKTYGVMSRVKVLDTVKKSLSEEQLRIPTSTKEIIPESYSKTLTIATTQDCPIPSDEWISTLSRADFYLACPGVGMPLCHNLIEALAAGSIPILQYPQYLDPPLTDGENCLVFSSQDELHSAINRALTMDTEEITQLQTSALVYYQNHLQPGAFAKKLTTTATPLIHLYVNAYRIAKALT